MFDPPFPILLVYPTTHLNHHDRLIGRPSVHHGSAPVLVQDRIEEAIRGVLAVGVTLVGRWLDAGTSVSGHVVFEERDAR